LGVARPPAHDPFPAGPEHAGRGRGIPWGACGLDLLRRQERHAGGTKHRLLGAGDDPAQNRDAGDPSVPYRAGGRVRRSVALPGLDRRARYVEGRDAQSRHDVGRLSVLARDYTLIEDAADPRIAAYRDIRERDLVGREGKFVAEGKTVLNVLFSNARLAAESVFLRENRVEGAQALLAKVPEDVPVYVATGAVMDQIAGFHMHRGVLAIGRRVESPD